MSLGIGTRLGPYEITGSLGAGGMGEVYRARDTRLDRTVAIKVLPELLASDSTFRARFDREPRAISALNHPHICTLHDIVAEGPTAYLVMEHVDGDAAAYDVARKFPTQITFGPERSSGAIWTRDDSRLIYSVQRESGSALMRRAPQAVPRRCCSRIRRTTCFP